MADPAFDKLTPEQAQLAWEHAADKARTATLLGDCVEKPWEAATGCCLGRGGPRRLDSLPTAGQPGPRCARTKMERTSAEVASRHRGFAERLQVGRALGDWMATWNQVVNGCFDRRMAASLPIFADRRPPPKG